MGNDKKQQLSQQHKELQQLLKNLGISTSYVKANSVDKKQANEVFPD